VLEHISNGHPANRLDDIGDQQSPSIEAGLC
jgi:hypothetical protein